METVTGLERRVAASLRRAGFSPAGVLIVAASGGPDSTALLRCLHRLRKEHCLRLHVAHLNHDFRGAEADHDAAFVQRLADSLGLPCSIDKQDPVAYQRQKGISSFEQTAREMRYAFLSLVAESVGADAVALGHTADDQAETVLLHLLRGSGIHGMRGMSEVARWPWPEAMPGLLLFRPLLGAGKTDTAAYCRAVGQSFREDSGNYMWRFTRNKVRHDLMPRLSRGYNPRIREALVRLSRVAAEEVDFIEGELARRWPGIAAERPGGICLEVAALTAMHPALQRHALRRAYSAVAGDPRSLGGSHLDAMMSLLQSEEGSRSADLPRGVNARRQYDALLIERPPERPYAPDLPYTRSVALPQSPGERVDTLIGGWRMIAEAVGQGQPGAGDTWQAGQFAARLNLAALGPAVTVRNRRPGDRFQPSGMYGTKKLQDFFTDAKILREQRDAVPLVVGERGIAWVVGHRVAEWAAASEDGAALAVRFEPSGTPAQT